LSTEKATRTSYVRSSIVTAIDRAKLSVADAAFPRRCAGCGKRGAWVCPECDAEFERFEPPWCRRCGTPRRIQPCFCNAIPSELRQFRAFGPHLEWLRKSIHALKYGEETARARHLGSLLGPLLETLEPWDWVVPVPLHASRQRERGFNQAELLAQFAVPDKSKILPALVRRIRATPQQVGLDAATRRTNLLGAFAAVEPELTQGKRIVLVDDVMTTGSTLQQCAVVLLDAGAASVSAVTLAVGMRSGLSDDGAGDSFRPVVGGSD
jgi:ComF family protein